MIKFISVLCKLATSCIHKRHIKISKDVKKGTNNRLIKNILHKRQWGFTFIKTLAFLILFGEYIRYCENFLQKYFVLE